jgi:ATP-binding cassette subfamily B protein
LDDVSLDIPEGTTTALIGPSGSGKSTLATLVARFADPEQGFVSIGGVDLQELSYERLYSTVSFVLQGRAVAAHVGTRQHRALPA